MTTIADRFFSVYADLIAARRTTQRRFCEDLDTDRRNFSKLINDHSHMILRAEWLAVMVLKYGVSADWLLTGRGWEFGQ